MQGSSDSTYPQDFREYVLLHVRIVYSDGAASNLDAIQDEVIMLAAYLHVPVPQPPNRRHAAKHVVRGSRETRRRVRVKWFSRVRVRTKENRRNRRLKVIVALRRKCAMACRASCVALRKHMKCKRNGSSEGSGSKMSHQGDVRASKGSRPGVKEERK